MAISKKSVNSLYHSAIDELKELLVPTRYRQNNDVERTIDRLSLSTFVEATSTIYCEPWQHHLCSILETFTVTRGRRLLCHKPPQHGGSIIVSQRFPSYLIGDKPDERVVIATHNIEKSTEFSQINLQTMQSPEYKSMFPGNGTDLGLRPSAKHFRTRARREHRDGQWSINSLGLETGFVGTGADTLIIDDPYASPKDALSPAINKSVWQFWTQGAKVRIDDNSNVVIMFHRYHEDDFIGQLIKEEGLLCNGGIWELISYRAQWDGDERLEIGGPDPMQRNKGEYLSPRKARQKMYYAEQKRNPQTWLSQFQGKPSKEDGSFFLVTKFRIMTKVLVKLVKVCRSWDIASSEDGDWTVGTLAGLGEDEQIYILDVVRFRKNTDQRNTIMRRTANRDKVRFPSCVITVPQDPSSAGKDMTKVFIKVFKGHEIKTVDASHRGNKEVKADGYSSYVNAGYVILVYNGDINEKNPDTGENICWIPDFIEEHRRFTGLGVGKDDQIDSASDCFNELALEIEAAPGEDFDTVGLNWEEYHNPRIETEDDLIYALYEGINEISEFDGERTDRNYETTRSSPSRGETNILTKIDPRARKAQKEIKRGHYNFNRTNKR